MAVKRKYIDSHWLVFIFQGAIALIFGCMTLFTDAKLVSGQMPLISLYLLSLAVVEFANAVYRGRKHQGWLVSILVALVDLVFGIVAIFSFSDAPMVWNLALVAAYTLLRGVFEIVIGYRTTVDPTDRFIWIACGVAGVVFGFVILNSGHLENIEFLRFFGAYLLIFGMSSLIYGVHNRTQSLEDRETRALAAKKATKTKAKKASKKA